MPAGEICVLVGPSGCGKTTAMRMVNRTVEITDGDILVGGDVGPRPRSPAELRREIGYVIQQIGPVPAPHDRRQHRHRPAAARLGPGADPRPASTSCSSWSASTPTLARPLPGQLSGGQQQRVGVARALAADPPVMLMDEPFGAVDPINRERLQNEFLRLQAEMRKTILFVTHDIDEAIKMGDRIAVLREGGQLAQYATPAELLMAPADDFVEDFVGADRALKRLALMRVADIDLWEAPLAFVGQATARGAGEARRRGGAPRAARRLASGGRSAGSRSRTSPPRSCPQTPDSGPEPILDLDDVMRDALSDLLQAESHYAPVVDAQGRIAGVLSVEIISEFLDSREAMVEEHPAAERPLG